MTGEKNTELSLIKLSGKIKKYKSTRARANFFFTKNDQNAMGLAAIASAAIGSSGLAMGTAIAASDMEEEADYVEFEIDGQPVKGWVWRSPFGNNDIVDVVGQWQDDHFELSAIARPSDRMIALYPHCSRGKSAHIKSAIKWWLLGVAGFMGLVMPFVAIGAHFAEQESLLGIVGSIIGFFLPFFLWLFFGRKGIFYTAALILISFFSIYTIEQMLFALPYFLMVVAFMYLFLGCFAINYTWRSMKFVNVATYVFDALGFENPSNIDLPKASSAVHRQLIKEKKITPDSVEGFGSMYFKY